MTDGGSAAGAGALTGLRVVECGQGIAAAYCAKLFADLGADVLKAETPAGDVCRARPPTLTRTDGTQTSGLFEYLNANKRGVSLDLGSDAGQEGLRTLVSAADLLVHNYEPADATRWGLSFDALAASNPRLVVTSITGFGRTGPHAGFRTNELICSHAGGWASLSPGSLENPELPPLKAFGAQTAFVAGVAAAVASLGGIFSARQRGAGEDIDVSTQEAVASILEAGLSQFLYHGTIATRLGTWTAAWLDPLECRDGFVVMLLAGEEHWQRLVAAMDGPEWASWDVFATAELRAENYDVLTSFLVQWTRALPVATVIERLLAHRVSAAEYNDVAGVLRCPQLAAREYFATVAGGFPAMAVPGAPYRLSRTPWRIRASAPGLGQHNALLAKAATIWEPRADSPAATPSPRLGTSSGRAPEAVDAKHLPLEGVRVVDITWAWAGPLCGMLLASLGAEVIKIESAARLDMARTGPFFKPGASPNIRPNFNAFNQGKRSLTLDLTSDAGKRLVRSLVDRSDVLVENLTPGVMQRFGLDYETLRPAHPGLVMISLSGFGATGPWSGRPSFGVPLVFTSGLASLTGYPGGGPRAVGISYPDPIAGMHGAFAVLSALRERARSGLGQYIDLSELESTISVLAEAFVSQALTGAQPERAGNRDPVHAPHGCYRCRGEDAWVAIAAVSDDDWRALAALMGRPELARDEQFATAAARKAHEDQLDATVEEWTAQRDRWEITESLQARGIAAFPTMTVSDLAADAQLAERGFFETWDHPEIPGRRHPGLPWISSGTQDHTLGHAPLLGEANDYVLGAVLGLGAHEIEALTTSGVIR